MPWRSATVWRSVLPLGLFRRLEVERAGIDLAPGQMHLQQFVHLLQLEIVVGDEVERAFLALDRAFAALEVEAGRDLAVDPGDGVVDFGEIEAGDDIKARHGRSSPQMIRSRCCDIARTAAPISGNRLLAGQKPVAMPASRGTDRETPRELPGFWSLAAAKGARRRDQRRLAAGTIGAQPQRGARRAVVDLQRQRQPRDQRADQRQRAQRGEQRLAGPETAAPGGRARRPARGSTRASRNRTSSRASSIRAGGGRMNAARGRKIDEVVEKNQAAAVVDAGEGQRQPAAGEPRSAHGNSP